MTSRRIRLSVVILIVLLLTPAVPRQAEANPFVWIVRGLAGGSIRRAAVGGVARSFGRSFARSGIRSVARGAGRSMIRSQVRRSLRSAGARRVTAHPGQSRMHKLFGRKSFEIRNARGRVIGRASVEGDRLVFRTESRKVGFAQWEKDGLHVYRASGRRVARITDKDDRILVFDDRNRYLGQFIQDLIEDQIIESFVDAMGEQHDHLVLTGDYPGLEVPERDRHYSYTSDSTATGFSTIRDGILYVYDEEGAELIRGVMEENILVLYDDTGEVRGTFKEDGELIVAYGKNGQRVGHIAIEEDRAVYYEEEEDAPSAWVELTRSS